VLLTIAAVLTGPGGAPFFFVFFRGFGDFGGRGSSGRGEIIKISQNPVCGRVSLGKR